ncbi:MAG TPA: DUF6036 family nucleotidyltransferase [bacterium]|nr:DUF6036 family nucleotidyltransferase [bacterium]
MNYKEYLERLKNIEEPFKKRLFFVAILTESLKESGIRPIIVGGNALEFYTLGDYSTGDIDLVSHRITEIGNLLESWGFKRVGRHWYHLEFDIAVEIPDEYLAGDYSRLTSVKIEGFTTYIIGIEDLIIDRLNACVHWSSLQDCEWVKELILLHKDDIDWDYLINRAKQEKTIETLLKIKDEIS